MGRKKRMAMSGMTVARAMGTLAKIPKGLVGSVGMITTPIYTIYQASKITRRKGEKLQLQVKNNLIVIERDSIKNLKEITKKLSIQDLRANITLNLEEISALVGGIRAESQETEHLIATLRTERNWKLKNLWSEYYTGMIKTALRNKTKRMNNTEAEKYTRLVSRLVIIINELEFKEEEKRCNTAKASTILVIPIPAQYSGVEYKEETNGKITPTRKTEEKWERVFNKKGLYSEKIEYKGKPTHVIGRSCMHTTKIKQLTPTNMLTE